MPTLFATALVAGFFVLTGAHAASAPNNPPEAVLPSLSATMTSYNAVAAQTDGDPMVTASGLRSNPEVIAARSQDLKTQLPFGTVIAIERDGADTPSCHFGAVESLIGYRVIGDTMNSRFTDRIDILLDQDDTVKVDGVPVNPSRALGVCGGTTVKVVGYMDLSDVPATQEELAKMVEGSDVAIR